MRNGWRCKLFSIGCTSEWTTIVCTYFMYHIIYVVGTSEWCTTCFSSLVCRYVQVVSHSNHKYGVLHMHICISIFVDISRYHIQYVLLSICRWTHTNTKWRTKTWWHWCQYAGIRMSGYTLPSTYMGISVDPSLLHYSQWGIYSPPSLIYSWFD